MSALVEGMKAGSLEVGVHPGRSEEWRDRDRASALELARSLQRSVALVNWRTLAAGATR